MFLHLVVCSFFICSVKCANYDFDQIKTELDQTLNYLKTVYVTDSNFIVYVSYVYAQLFETEYTVGQHWSDQERNAVLGYISNFALFLDTFRSSCDKISDALSTPQYWALNDFYRFRWNRLPKKMQPSEHTLDEIYLESLYTEFVDDCKRQVIEVNGRSDVLRQCFIPCEEIFDERNDFVTLADKTDFMIDTMLLNCTELTPDIAVKRMLPYCTEMMAQVLKMIEYKNDPVFDDMRFFFLLKVVECSGFGYSEFMDTKIILEVLRGINYNGSVGSDRRTDQEKAVLTVLTSTALSSVLRFVMEEKYLLHK